MDGRITGMNALRHNKLIDTGAVFLAQVPRLSAYPALLRRGLLFALQKFVCEDRINEFLLNNAAVQDFQFIDQVFSHLKIDYVAGDHDIDRPAGEFCTSCLAAHDLDTASGKCLAQDRLTCLIGKADSVGTVPEGLLGKQSGIAAGNKNLDVELFGTAFHECQCAGADRPSGTEDCKLLCHA